ncbi:SREBP regulating gene protein [Pectinophora gossypiella]|uniref:SREBP regulating gene protein n=1 Tax=Pectinophora gossypiella TaxID=13191 RepID=A0A1E1W395_PECGO|nr:SREBP regulating gene protein [Pectinophora gossypiella]
MMLLIYLPFSYHWSSKHGAYTMWYAALVRFIRRRLVLGIIFASSLTYCIVSFLREGSHRHMIYQDVSIERKPFVWRTLQEHNDTNDGISCRNSVQGKLLLVDDRGYICQRSDMMKNGCCDPDAESSKKYSCESCKENNCCIIYEHCVSCCLDPGKRDMLELVLSKLSAEENVLFRTLSDDYELCLTKCRTSSHSVLHENSYKDPAHKHCFGHEPPKFRTPD